VYALVTLLVVVALSLVVTRVGTVALTLTGLSCQAARFQSRSAFTGSGFTTAESKMVVDHPVRRRIVMRLMLLGNAGLVSSVGTLMLSLTEVQSTGQGVVRVAALLLGLGALVLLSRSRWVSRWMRQVIERSLRRHTDLDTRDYDELLHLSGDWRVVELKVEPDDWIARRPLAELDLPEEGILVLGITRRGGRYLGAR
jgi:hypothetical protein